MTKWKDPSTTAFRSRFVLWISFVIRASIVNRHSPFTAEIALL